MAITPLPTAPSRSDPNNFSARADAFMTALPTFANEANALQVDVNAKQVTASTAAVTATTQATNASASSAAADISANNAAASTGAVLWASGTTYALGVYVRSPADARIYRKLTASSSTTIDPSTDVTNYTPVFLEISSGLPTVQPTLNLDFANSGQLDSRVTFIRNSTATYYDKTGLLITAPANFARFDYDPITRNSLGLLIEESRTNLVTYSGAVGGTNWVLGTTTATLNAAIAPDGTLTASKIISNTTNTSHTVEANFISVASTTYSVSFYAKAGEYSVVYGWNAVNGGAWSFNLLTGVATGTGGSMVLVGNGWYRCTYPYTTAGTSGGVRFYLNSMTAFAGDGYSGIYIWGAQVEAGAFSTSYIPTVASTVTRAADQASMTGTNFSSWYNQSQGSFYTESDCPSNKTNSQIFEVGDSANLNRYNVRFNGSVNSARFDIVSAGVAVVANVSISDANTIKKISLAIKTATFSGCADGTYSLLSSQYPITMPIVTQLILGDYTAFAGVNLNGHIRKISYYPVALSSSNLVALTS